MVNIELEKNADAMRLAISGMNRHLNKIQEGGGKKRMEKLHAEGKMTARERIDYLLDGNSPRIEVGAFAGHEMYAEHGGCPAGGVVVVISASAVNTSGYFRNQARPIRHTNKKKTTAVPHRISHDGGVPRISCTSSDRYSRKSMLLIRI